MHFFGDGWVQTRWRLPLLVFAFLDLALKEILTRVIE